MSQVTNRAKKIEDIDGIHLSYGNNHWALRIDANNYGLYPVQKIQKGKNKGEWTLQNNQGKYFRQLKHMLPTMRRRGISNIMNRKDTQTLHELIDEIESFNDWCKLNFKIKVKGD